MIGLSHDRLLKLIAYDPITGLFSRGSDDKVGCEWSSPRSKTRYLKISIDNHQFAAHRLAWFYIHREWPTEIDHINGNGLDNRIANLRPATRSQNSANGTAQRSSKTGYRGVHFCAKTGRYRAQICKDWKIKSLGRFDTPEEAYAAYLEAAKTLHGEFIRRAVE